MPVYLFYVLKVGFYIWMWTWFCSSVDDIDEYEYADGEAIAGLILGWNMGDGHLHQQRLLEAVQNECQYEEGELRCIFVESQPIQHPFLAWTIADAKTGVIEWRRRA